jgi:hypothetical protein
MMQGSQTPLQVVTVRRFPTLQERVWQIMQTGGFCSKSSFVRSLGYGNTGKGPKRGYNSCLIDNILSGKSVNYTNVCRIAKRLDKIPLILWKDKTPLRGLQQQTFQHPINYGYLTIGYIGDTMYVERTQRGLSQSRLATRCRLPVGFISHLEAYYGSCKVNRLETLCMVLGLDAEWLAEPLEAE